MIQYLKNNPKIMFDSEFYILYAKMKIKAKIQIKKSSILHSTKTLF